MIRRDMEPHLPSVVQQGSDLLGTHQLSMKVPLTAAKREMGSRVPSPRRTWLPSCFAECLPRAGLILGFLGWDRVAQGLHSNISTV